MLETCKGGWALDWSRVHACTMLQDGTTDREAQGSVFGRLKQIACACASLWHRHGRDTATSVRGFPAARVRGGGVAAATGLLHLHKKKAWLEGRQHRATAVARRPKVHPRAAVAAVSWTTRPGREGRLCISPWGEGVERGRRDEGSRLSSSWPSKRSGLRLAVLLVVAIADSASASVSASSSSRMAAVFVVSSCCSARAREERKMGCSLLVLAVKKSEGDGWKRGEPSDAAVPADCRCVSVQEVSESAYVHACVQG